MTLQVSTLRPGLLVSLRTSVTGNVSYYKTIIESEHLDDEGKERAAWNTERVIADPKEHENAIRARSKVLTIIRKVCVNSGHGLLCLQANRKELDKAVTEARAVAKEFNTTATMTRLGVNIIAAEIKQDDVEAIRSIRSEVSDLMAEMKQGIKELNVKKVRDAAAAAKQIGKILTPDAQTKVTLAIEAARGVATEINKAIKAGEQAAIEIDKRAVRQITESRTAFLDLDDEQEVKTVRKASRAVDFEPEQQATAKQRRKLEVD